jgi:multidrug efflux pump subunit AcrA (membrane-fusion protein)
VSLLLATQITAVATAVLAFFAIITAVFAILAFRKQSAEVTTLQQEATDQQELIRQQAELLKVQSGQLDVQRQQLEGQRTVNAKQAEVMDLQARELVESLKQRQDEAERRHRDQASQVTAWFGNGPPRFAQSSSPMDTRGALIRNASDLPIFDVRAFFFFVDEVQPGGSWRPVPRGGPVERIRVVPPHADSFVAIPDKVSGMFPREVNDRTCVVGIEFTDAAEQRWERDPRGALLSRS